MSEGSEVVSIGAKGIELLLEAISRATTNTEDYIRLGLNAMYGNRKCYNKGDAKEALLEYIKESVNEERSLKYVAVSGNEASKFEDLCFANDIPTSPIIPKELDNNIEGSLSDKNGNMWYAVKDIDFDKAIKLAGIVNDRYVPEAENLETIDKEFSGHETRFITIDNSAIKRDIIEGLAASDINFASLELIDKYNNESLDKYRIELLDDEFNRRLDGEVSALERITAKALILNSIPEIQKIENENAIRIDRINKVLKSARNKNIVEPQIICSSRNPNQFIEIGVDGIVKTNIVREFKAVDANNKYVTRTEKLEFDLTKDDNFAKLESAIFEGMDTPNVMNKEKFERLSAEIESFDFEHADNLSKEELDKIRNNDITKPTLLQNQLIMTKSNLSLVLDELLNEHQIDCKFTEQGNNKMVEINIPEIGHVADRIAEFSNMTKEQAQSDPNKVLENIKQTIETNMEISESVIHAPNDLMRGGRDLEKNIEGTPETVDYDAIEAGFNPVTDNTEEVRAFFDDDRIGLDADENRNGKPDFLEDFDPNDDSLDEPDWDGWDDSMI